MSKPTTGFYAEIDWAPDDTIGETSEEGIENLRRELEPLGISVNLVDKEDLLDGPDYPQIRLWAETSYPLSKWLVDNGFYYELIFDATKDRDAQIDKFNDSL